MNLPPTQSTNFKSVLLKSYCTSNTGLQWDHPCLKFAPLPPHFFTLSHVVGPLHFRLFLYKHCVSIQGHANCHNKLYQLRIPFINWLIAQLLIVREFCFVTVYVNTPAVSCAYTRIQHSLRIIFMYRRFSK